MSEKRPTREEAIEAAKKGWSSKIPDHVVTLGSAGEAAVDAVAALFGGYAPSAVEVPRVTWVRAEKFGIDAVVDRDGRLLSLPIIEAVAARSNAWEEVKEFVQAAHTQEVADGGNDSYVADKLSHVLDLMARPKMVIEPKNSK